MGKQSKNTRNLIGPAVRRLRCKKGITQEVFAARCNVLGLDISRGTLSKIEACLRKVSDIELLFLAKALKVNVDDLFPRN
ncbi:MAG: helix-turn-helix domain-containing protein [Verrucomicrobiales bacterium]